MELSTNITSQCIRTWQNALELCTIVPWHNTMAWHNTNCARPPPDTLQGTSIGISVDLQFDEQNSYLFTYNTFIKILYMFRALSLHIFRRSRPWFYICSLWYRHCLQVTVLCTGWERMYYMQINKNFVHQFGDQPRFQLMFLAMCQVAVEHN